MKKKKTIREKLQKKISSKKSNWLDDAIFAEENEAWLEKSSQIAIKILRYLRSNKISQVELSKKLGVSAQYVNKIVKGKENLSLETICKIESALEVSLIEVVSSKSTIEVYNKIVVKAKGVSRLDASSIYNGNLLYASCVSYSDNENDLIAA